MTDNCCCCCSSLIYFILLLSFVVTTTIVLPYFDFTLEQCYVKSVTYPTSLPINGCVDGLSGYIDCSCGRKCISTIGTCINIFVSTSYDSYTEYKINYDITERPGKCSITGAKCSHGPDISIIKSAITTGTYYYGLINTNTTIDCYVNNRDEYYINNSFNMIGYIIFASIVGCITLCILYPIMYHCITDNTTCYYIYSCMIDKYKIIKAYVCCPCSTGNVDPSNQCVIHIKNNSYKCHTFDEQTEKWVFVAL